MSRVASGGHPRADRQGYWAGSGTTLQPWSERLQADSGPYPGAPLTRRQRHA